MAVITGTPWDLALNQRAHRAPVIEPTGPETGPLSARAAFQQVLYQRARIVDIRTTQERDHTGHLDDVPDVVEIDVTELIVWLVQHDSAVPVILLSQDGAEAAAISSALAEVDLADVAHVHGGFVAWERSGLLAGR